MLTSKELALIESNPYKKDFPLLAANPKLVFLDSAATAQRPYATLDAQRYFYETMNANPLRGLYRLSVEATQAIADARTHIASFIGAVDASGTPQADEIVFTRNASESLNLVAKTLGPQILGPGDEVVISIMEHHSNLIPWQQVCRATGATLVYLYMDDTYHIPPEEITSKIGSHTKIVAVTQVSNVLGVENDIAAIATRAHEVGAYMLVDGAQSAPHIAVSVHALGCDFFAFSAHKMGGPMGVGVLWAKKNLLESLPPFLTGGEMIESVTKTDAVWAPVPQKFEAGTQDAAGIYAFDAGLSYLEAKGKETLETRERILARYLCEQLQALDFVEVIGPLEPQRHIASVTFNVGDVHPHDVASLLDFDSICIRAGHHCAQPLLRELGFSSTCRASVAFYNDKTDIDRLVGGLCQVWQVFHGSNKSL